MTRRGTTDTTPGLAIITGASAGIGRELALCAARDGHPLLVTARTRSALEQVAVEARAAGAPDVTILACDLSGHDAPQQVVDAARATGMPISVLVNNAGVGVHGPMRDADPAALTAMIDLNVRAVVLLSRLLVDDLEASRGGILNVASLAAFQPGPGMATYHATKWAVLAFSLAIRNELAGRGVRVTTLCPGPVPTGFQQQAGFAEPPPLEIGNQPADKVARLGWRGLRRGTDIVLPGALVRLSAWGSRLVSWRLTTRLARRALGGMRAA